MRMGVSCSPNAARDGTESRAFWMQYPYFIFCDTEILLALGFVVLERKPQVIRWHPANRLLRDH